jgi:chitin disaccharide deacetylase
MKAPSLPRRDFLKLSATGIASGVLGLGSGAKVGAAESRPAANTIRLIVRGDDMGFSHSGNEALIKCYREGVESSIEVIAAAPWFPEAVRLLAENPGIDVGVHLALTSEWDNVKWRPLTHCPSLVDANGYFFPMVRPNKNYPGRSILENKWKLDEVEQEFRAQIRLVQKHVPRVSHVSAHMGCSSLSPDVSAMTRRISKELNVDIDLNEHGVKAIRYLGPKGTFAEKLASFLQALESMQPGGTYLFVDHPGLDTPELRAISHIGYEDVAADRQGVTDTWTHPRVKAFIKDHGIQLIGYRDLKRTV